MSEESITKRAKLTMVQVDTIVQWIRAKTEVTPILQESIRELSVKASVELELPISPSQMRNIIEQFGFVTSKAASRKQAKEESDPELLLRIKRIEKFLAKYFAEEWANTIL